MGILKKLRGLTYIETMISATIVAFVILGSVNLISSVYKGITANTVKTYSLNIASEAVDIMKQDGFQGLNVTPDSCLPAPLSNLENSTCVSNYDTYTRVTIDAQVFHVYKYVMWALEDTNGNIVGKRESELTSGDSLNAKQITVIVNYFSNKTQKTSTVTSLLSNKEVPVNGSSVAGTISLHHPSGPDTNPGLGSGGTVHFVGYPQYTTGIDDDAGNYTVENVMPGSYTLYAEGAGFIQTFYTSNPLVVPPIATAIIGVNFSCDAVIGSSVSGNIYIGVVLSPTETPTDTPTEIPTSTPTMVCSLLKNLAASGAMSGITQGWTNPTRISADDALYSNASGNNKRLYTEFADYTQAGTSICRVNLKTIASHGILGGNLLVSFTNYVNPTRSWANTANPPVWTGNQDSIRENINITDTEWVIYTNDITDLYTSWDWAKVNSLGACFKTVNANLFINLPVYIQASWLEVSYDVIPPTPTPVNTPTFTPTINATETPIPCGVTARVIASDGLSQPYVVTDCEYTVTNINPAFGTVDIAATLYSGGITYYAITQGVAVSPGTTTTGIDLMLEELTGVPSLRGVVRDASNHAIYLSGVDIYLGLTKVATTGGGGAYAVVPVAPGTHVLSAAAAGYSIEQTYSYDFTTTSGLREAADLYMMPSGAITGTITDFVTGDPVIGKNVEVRTSSEAFVKSGSTDSLGVYLIEGIDVGSAYKVYVDIDDTEECIFPKKEGYHSPVVVVKGVTTLNKDFKVKFKYKKIRGKITINGLDIKNGITVIAVPTAVTLPPHNFRMDSATPTNREYTGRNRVLYPSYALALERDGSFEIKAPVNTTYRLYAYYSYISYTGDVNNSVKTLVKYYKILGGVTVGTDDITGQDITGALSSWTAY